MNATHEALQRANAAKREIARLTGTARADALFACADAIVAATSAIVAANAEDLARGIREGLPPNLLDRLQLDTDRVIAMANGIREVASLPDPLGVTRREVVRQDGLRMREITVPFGVVGIICEARPNVTTDAFAITFRCGSACVLRCGSAARDSARVIVDVLRATLSEKGLSPDAIVLLDVGERCEVSELLSARGLVDLIIPRGSAELIAMVVDTARVPVIETGSGNCHVYVDSAADLDIAKKVVLNSKTSRTSVCNAAESLLVHQVVADEFLPQIMQAFREEGVLVHGDARSVAAAKAAGCAVEDATALDWDLEYLASEIAVRVVDSLEAAIEHVHQHSTGHTEAIITDDAAAAARWQTEIDAAVVTVNASTRFTDGGEFGFGTEIGISTQKLHARGPMGLAELVTTKWLIDGDGHIR